jgi:MFS family permease
MPQQLLDPIPLLGVFLGFIVLSLIAFEIGFRIGVWRKAKDPDEEEGASGLLIGSLLGLLAFLLAITMGMASDRFDTRRGLVLEEATTINTAYLRAGYLPEPYQAEIRNLLREYVPLRIAPEGQAVAALAANIARSEEIHDDLWAVTESVATEVEATDITALYIESVNEIITLHAQRVTAGVFARVPDTVLLFLLILAIGSTAMVGFGAGRAGRRNVVTATLMIVALGATFTLVVDLDRPRDGLLTVSQRPLIELQEKLGEPEP